MLTWQRRNRMMELVQELHNRMMELELHNRSLVLALHNRSLVLVLGSSEVLEQGSNEVLELDSSEVLEQDSKLVLLEHSNRWPSLHGAWRAIRRRCIPNPCLHEAWPKGLADRRNLPLQRIRS